MSKEVLIDTITVKLEERLNELNQAKRKPEETPIVIKKPLVKEFISVFLEYIIDQAESNGEVRISGLGKFYTREIKTGLPAGHPLLKPGSAVKAPGTKTVLAFKCGETVKKKLN